MKKTPPKLVVTGQTYSSKVLVASAGDVAIHPGAGRTRIIDATVFDGTSWRLLDLEIFGFTKKDRMFDHQSEVGPLMRDVEKKIAARKGMVINYEAPPGSSRRKYR